MNLCKSTMSRLKIVVLFLILLYGGFFLAIIFDFQNKF